MARALAIGGLSRLDPRLPTIDIWDPAVGSGFAGFVVTEALRSAGLHVRYRGQDINETAVSASRRRFENVPDAEFAVGNTLEHDEFEAHRADLVIVDAPWGMNWAGSASVVDARRKRGTFRFGIPQRSDSTWLFISLALEKLRMPAEGGGRVTALVNPGVLRSGGAGGAVRQRILEAGLLESVTRLPDGLAPNTSIPLYLLTFTNRPSEVARGTAMIADLQTQFTGRLGHRIMLDSAFRELESALRTKKSGPRNRSIGLDQFIRRETRLTRRSSAGRQISWRITTYNNTLIDGRLLESRYGADAGVSIDEEPREVFDLDPGHVFGDDTRELLKDMAAKSWPSRRLSGLLAREPEVVEEPGHEVGESQLFIPTTRDGQVLTEMPDSRIGGRLLMITLDPSLAVPSFLAAWLNSEQGVLSRRRAIEAASSGNYFKALRSDVGSLMRWVDEIIVPVPSRSTQLALASADERLASYQAALSSQRERVWASPSDAEEVVGKLAHAFDDSLTTWFEQLPFPVASALWTAETAPSLSDKLQAYVHAWEALVTFHATVLLSAVRNDPTGSAEVETSIRNTLLDQHIGIERASFGTWVVIVECTAKNLRRILEQRDPDDLARVRAAFGDLNESAIERLISKDIVKKFNEVCGKRNRWHGHSGYTSEEDRKAQVESLVSDLRELRQLLGSVWAQLLLVRAGSARRGRDGYIQAAEVAVGTRSPFVTREFRVGDAMLDGELYLTRDGSSSPLRLARFVQLRAAPRNAQYTSYFYNRTDGTSVRMVSYQYGPQGEVEDDASGFRVEFGALSVE